jgi:hypothetical protein
MCSRGVSETCSLGRIHLFEAARTISTPHRPLRVTGQNRFAISPVARLLTVLGSWI